VKTIKRLCKQHPRWSWDDAVWKLAGGTDGDEPPEKPQKKPKPPKKPPEEPPPAPEPKAKEPPRSHPEQPDFNQVLTTFNEIFDKEVFKEFFGGPDGKKGKK